MGPILLSHFLKCINIKSGLFQVFHIYLSLNKTNYFIPTKKSVFVYLNPIHGHLQPCPYL